MKRVTIDALIEALKQFDPTLPVAVQTEPEYISFDVELDLTKDGLGQPVLLIVAADANA